MATLDILAQIGIMVFGCLSIWFVSRREHWRRWGYIFGMCGQPFWIFTTLYHEQWGIAAVTLIYAYSWGQGIWFYWIQDWLRSRKLQNENSPATE